LATVPPSGEGTIICAIPEKAPNVEIIDAALAISGADGSRRNVMEGRTLAKADQHQSLLVRLPALNDEKILQSGRALSLKAVEGQRA
jgi:hypothetical protein